MSNTYKVQFLVKSNMGLALLISLSALVVIVVLGIISHYTTNKEQKERIESFIGLCTLVGFVMWFMAVATRDPITDFLSSDAQLLIVGLSFAGVAWKYYFDPMKRRISVVENEIVGIKVNLEHLTKDMHIIKEKILKS